MTRDKYKMSSLSVVIQTHDELQFIFTAFVGHNSHILTPNAALIKVELQTILQQH